MTRIAHFDTLARDLRHAVRNCSRMPLFTITVVVTLALAIGTSAAMFSLVDAVTLRPLPFPESDRLMHVGQVQAEVGETTAAPIRLSDWSELNSTFEAISGYTMENVSDLTVGLPERIRRATVLPGFLEVWGVQPALGRGFTEAEHRLGSSAVLISDRYWRERFQRDPDVLDSVVRFEEDRTYSVVGVMPPSFRFPDRDVDWWTPEWLNAPWTTGRGLAYYVGIGRLNAGVTVDQARADLARVQAQLAKQYPDSDREIGPIVEPLKDRVIGDVSSTLWLLFGAVTVLLLISCTNVAALLLSRAVRQEHETAIRFSLGATRRAVLAQVITEAAYLASMGAMLGFVVAEGVSRAIPALAPELPRLDELGLTGRMFGYMLLAAVLVTLACGALPAIRMARQHGLSRAAHARIVSPHHTLQWLLVGLQVSLSVTLVVAAGLLIRGGWELSRVDPGFEAGNVLTFRVSATFGEAEYDQVIGRINSTLDELTALPDVQASASSSLLPGIGDQFVREFEFADGRPLSEATAIAESRTVSPDYFDVMGIPLLAGDLCRRPTSGDEAADRMEMMVNRSFVDRYFSGRTVIGQALTSGFSARVVGIVGNAREVSVGGEPVPTAYFCFSAVSPFPWFSIRTNGDPMLAVAAVRAKINAIEPARAVYDVDPLERRISDAYAESRLRTILLMAFGVAALGLACFGIYGTLSYVVSLRGREIGLRVALGARAETVALHFLSKALRVVGLACLLGLAVSVVFSGALSSMLYGISPTDPATFGAVAAVVMIIGAVAAIVPAVRASRIDPMRALRED
jgi:putative ABC transport system permease protein